MSEFGWLDRSRYFNSYDNNPANTASNLIIAFFVTDIILGILIYISGGLKANRWLLHFYYFYSVGGTVLTVLLASANLGLSAGGCFTSDTSSQNFIIGALNHLGCFVTIALLQRGSSDDEQQQESTIQVAAQMHRNVASNVLSDSIILEELESSYVGLPTYPQPQNEHEDSIFNYPDSLNLSDLPLSPHSTNQITNTIVARPNGAILSDPGIITEEFITYTEPEPQYSQEIIVRTSHDPDTNIIIETIDALHDSEQPLDTSTPLGSPSISTIMQNVEIESLNSFHIDTPNSSMCITSPMTPMSDETYVPSSIDEKTENDADVSNTEERELTKKKRKVKKKTDLGRIRKVNKSSWIDSKRKQLKNQGLSYISRNGKAQSKKLILPACNDECRLKCKEKIGEDVRNEMFKQFWSLGNRERQWDFLVRWCKRIGKRRITTEGLSKRLFFVKYYLPKTLDVRHEEVTVCKKMFLNTFAIGDGVVRTALKKLTDGEGVSIGSDQRGLHNNHPKIKNDEMIKSVSDHVRSFTPVESHYTRKESSKLYLDSELTMTKMFKLYNEWVSETESNRAKTLRQYTDIVNENFNIEFHRPKKDQCDVCIAFKNQPKPVNHEIQEQFDEHLRNKDMARSLKNEDKLSAINSPSTTITAAFDFQKVHSCPHAETSILYYKRKLNVFNFTIFEMGQKVGTCYMWHEDTAKRGANEVASCVYDFIKNQSSKGIQTINLYSDNCGGQNRNRIVFMMYLIAAKEFKVNITHRFLEKGHTQNENDSIHALIERCSKNKEIYTPDQWFALVRWAKETGSPYIVKEVARDDILDFKKLLSGNNWSKNDRNIKIMWSKIREIHVSSSEPDILKYKNTFNETYHRLFVRRTQNRRRQNQTVDMLSQAYTGPLPILNAKLMDLKYLCEHNVIPRQYHGFYNSLVSCDVIDSSSDEEQ